MVEGGVEVDGGGAVGGEWRGAERGARQQGLDVDAGAADADRNLSAGLDSSAGDACRPGRAEDLEWAIYVNQMVGYASSFAVELAGGGMTRWVELPRRRGWARRTPHRQSEEPGSAQTRPAATSDRE